MKYTQKIINSQGLKSNRQIGRAESSTKIKSRPTASSLKALGYTVSQREIILSAYREI